MESKTLNEKRIIPEPFFKPLAQNQTTSKQFYKRTISYFFKELWTVHEMAIARDFLPWKYTKCLDERRAVK